MKRILVAPLNWGLGHASRSIPLIQALEKAGAEVFLASDGAALHLLKAEFPHLPVLRLPSYKIRYAGSNMVRNIGAQLPRIIYAIRSEQRATESIVKKYGIHGVLSDNRYGCFSRAARSNVLLTHQLEVRTPIALLQWGANRVLQLALRKFDRIWAPDAAGDPNLSGALSHGWNKHPFVQFIGVLSRMRDYPREMEYDVAVVLSGPEPQRSALESLLLEQAMVLPQKFIFIQGKTESKQHYYAADHVEVVSYLTSKELNDVLCAAGAVVCRSGYSSIMDLAAIGKKALLIPTPGQTEQEYLADLLAAQSICCVQKQTQINLENALETIPATRGFTPGQFACDDFIPILNEWLDSL